MSSTAEKDQSTQAPKATYVDIARDIEEFYIDNAIAAWCPVTCESLNFKPLSVSQLKRFVEYQLAAAKDEIGVIPQLNMAKSLNSVIGDNCIDNEDALKTLTIIDRDAIIVQLRANIKNTADITGGDDETVTVNLGEVVTNIKGKKASQKLTSKTKVFKSSTGKITLGLRIPTIARDQFVNETFKRKIQPKLKKGKEQVQKDLEKILSELYLLELSKYIETLELTKGDGAAKLTFDDSSLFQNIQLLEKLPSNIVSEISTFVADIKAFRDSLICYTDSGNDVPLDIDANIFTGI